MARLTITRTTYDALEATAAGKAFSEYPAGDARHTNFYPNGTASIWLPDELYTRLTAGGDPEVKLLKMLEVKSN